MNDREREQAIRRILIALDASATSFAALERAVNLAAGLEAELLGLFVEDINLLRLAGLPFSQELRTTSAVLQQLNSRRVETEMRAQAIRLQRALQEAARQARVKASFRVVRGRVDMEVLTAAGDADLLMLGKVSQPLTRRIRIGSTARMVAARVPRSVLFLQRGGDPRLPVLVAYDGSTLAQQALTITASLNWTSRDLYLLLMVDSPDEVESLQQQASTTLQERGLSAEYHWIVKPEIHQLIETVRKIPCSLLILGSEQLQISETEIYALLDAIDCSLMIIR